MFTKNNFYIVNFAQWIVFHWLQGWPCAALAFWQSVFYVPFAYDLTEHRMPADALWAYNSM